MKKSVTHSQMIENFLIWREKAKQIWRETSVIGGRGDSTAVSSVLYCTS